MSIWKSLAILSGLVLFSSINATDPDKPTQGTDGAGATHAAETESISDAETCPQSDDQSYGLTFGNPIGVGGGPFGSLRSKQFMSVLRGPAGEGLKYGRNGATANADRHYIDIWLVQYDGLDKPIAIYLNQYVWKEPQIPYGFTCSAPIGLAAPG